MILPSIGLTHLCTHGYNSSKPSGNGSGKYTPIIVNLHRWMYTPGASPTLPGGHTGEHQERYLYASWILAKGS